MPDDGQARRGRGSSPPGGARAVETAEGMPEDPHPLPPPTAWFARDAERHLLDAPRHCPRCGGPLSGPAGLVVEYWAADDRVFYCWCRACDWTGTVVQVDRHIGHEAAG
ncbi:MAG TPA: hypothetical protein VFA46_20965 [Actinomycetes bacterium]|nr:hypothetical protein [Actinomycetes bacterium]